jgi:hypothetical protein
VSWLGPPADEAAFDGVELARRLLSHRLVVAGRPHLLEEVELYLWGRVHRDPYAHAHPEQGEAGRWVFHRAGRGRYRGGSFKGVDLAFGAEPVRGGALLRTIREVGGDRICGPSKVVDHLLARTGVHHVAELAGEARRLDDGPLGLVDGEPPEVLHRSPRVGLGLKVWHPDKPAFLGRRLRFLTDPRIPKGRLQTLLGLYRDGESAEGIAGATGSPRAHVARVVEAFEAGRRSAAVPEDFAGRALDTLEEARLHGLLERYDVGP